MHGSQVQWMHLIKYIHSVPFDRYLNDLYNCGLSNTFVHDRVHWRLRFEVIVNRRDIFFHYAFRNIGRRHIIFFSFLIEYIMFEAYTCIFKYLKLPNTQRDHWFPIAVQLCFSLCKLQLPRKWGTAYSGGPNNAANGIRTFILYLMCITGDGI